MRRICGATGVTLAALFIAGCANTPAAPATQFHLPPGASKPAYSEAVEVQSAGIRTLYASSLVPEPVDRSAPPNSAAAFGDMAAQTDAMLVRIREILARHGYAMKDVVKVTVYLVADPTTGKVDNDGFSQAYAKHFGGTATPSLPARTRVTVAGLTNPMARIAMDVIAVKQ
jgi:enamine deaminase RidA (YjgF/YER057c/UK114 family)